MKKTCVWLIGSNATGFTTQAKKYNVVGLNKNKTEGKSIYGGDSDMVYFLIMSRKALEEFKKNKDYKVLVVQEQEGN